jgi:hypothetical protein
LNQNELRSAVQKEVHRILPTGVINWETLGHQMDSLDRLEFVEHLGAELSVSLDILLMNPGIWTTLESLSEFIFKVVSETLDD